MKPISFLGNSLECLHEFPEDARHDAGYALDQVQRGKQPSDFKPMATVGKGVEELRVCDDAGTYEDADEETRQHLCERVGCSGRHARAQAANLQARADLMRQIAELIQAEGWKQVEAAERCGVTQPRINDLLRGRVSRFSLDALVNIATALGRRVNVELEVA